MMHACIALGTAIIFGPRHLHFASIGTHLLENSIGIGRRASNNTEYSRIAFANCEMRKTLAGDSGVSLCVSRSVNDSGAKIYTSSSVGMHGMLFHYYTTSVLEVFELVQHISEIPSAKRCTSLHHSCPYII